MFSQMGNGPLSVWCCGPFCGLKRHAISAMYSQLDCHSINIFLFSRKKQT